MSYCCVKCWKYYYSKLIIVVLSVGNMLLLKTQNKMANTENSVQTAHHEPSHQDLHCFHNKMANNVEPDEKAHTEPFHQDLHYLRRYLLLVCFK